MFWLLAFEEVERFVVERLRKTEKPLASQLLNRSTPQLILHLLPAFTAGSCQRLALGSRIQLQQRNCSRFARDFSRRPTFPSSQRTKSKITPLPLRAQDKFG